MMEHFTFYRTYYEALRELPDELVKEVVVAMSAYVFDGEEIELRGDSKAIFMLIKPILEAEMQDAETQQSMT